MVIGPSPAVVFRGHSGQAPVTSALIGRDEDRRQNGRNLRPSLEPPARPPEGHLAKHRPAGRACPPRGEGSDPTGFQPTSAWGKRSGHPHPHRSVVPRSPAPRPDQVDDLTSRNGRLGGAGPQARSLERLVDEWAPGLDARFDHAAGGQCAGPRRQGDRMLADSAISRDHRSRPEFPRHPRFRTAAVTRTRRQPDRICKPADAVRFARGSRQGIARAGWRNRDRIGGLAYGNSRTSGCLRRPVTPGQAVAIVNRGARPSCMAPE